MASGSINARAPITQLLSRFKNSALTPLSDLFDMFRPISGSLDVLKKLGFCEHLIRVSTPEEEVSREAAALPQKLAKTILEVRRSITDNVLRIDPLISLSDLNSLSVPSIAVVMFVLSEQTLIRKVTEPEEGKQWPLMYVFTADDYMAILYTPEMTYLDHYDPASGKIKAGVLSQMLVDSICPTLYHMKSRNTIGMQTDINLQDPFDVAEEGEEVDTKPKPDLRKSLFAPLLRQTIQKEKIKAGDNGRLTENPTKLQSQEKSSTPEKPRPSFKQIVAEKAERLSLAAPISALASAKSIAHRLKGKFAHRENEDEGDEGDLKLEEELVEKQRRLQAEKSEEEKKTKAASEGKKRETAEAAKMSSLKRGTLGKGVALFEDSPEKEAPVRDEPVQPTKPSVLFGVSFAKNEPKGSGELTAKLPPKSETANAPSEASQDSSERQKKAPGIPKALGQMLQRQSSKVEPPKVDKKGNFAKDTADAPKADKDEDQAEKPVQKISFFDISGLKDKKEAVKAAPAEKPTRKPESSEEEEPLKSAGKPSTKQMESESSGDEEEIVIPAKKSGLGSKKPEALRSEVTKGGKREKDEDFSSSSEDDDPFQEPENFTEAAIAATMNSDDEGDDHDPNNPHFTSSEEEDVQPKKMTKGRDAKDSDSESQEISSGDSQEDEESEESSEEDHETPDGKTPGEPEDFTPSVKVPSKMRDGCECIAF